MKRVAYQEVQGRGGAYYLMLAALGAVMLGALAAAYRMEHYGHAITGMSNQIVWGMPHVFAVFLIVAASGALNVASMSSLFGRSIYKPLAPLSCVLALGLLAGGLAVLVLDLGRPDRLIVAMTTYNFKSIFAWNIFLYTGFAGVVLAVLVILLRLVAGRVIEFAGKSVSVLALVWRLTLTTGTGCIFGFLVAREAYDAAVMAPLFIAMSLAYGTAAFLLVLAMVSRWAGRDLGDAVVRRLQRLLGIFVAVVLYFVAVQHLTNLYAAEHHGVELFILAEGGVFTALFWLVQVGLGGVVPLLLVFGARARRGGLGVPLLAAALVILGGFAQVYVIIIGGQAYPLALFPGLEVQSSFFDGSVGFYIPSGVEVMLGFGGVALALALVLMAARTLPILATSYADAVIDPHYKTLGPAAGGNPPQDAGAAEDAAAAETV